MVKIPNAQKHVKQYRGPSDSEQFNKNNDDVYQDLVYLHNAVNETRSNLNNGFSAVVKDINGIAKEIATIQLEVDALQAAGQTVPFIGNVMDDTDRFVGTSFEVNPSDRLYYSSRFQTYTLPRVQNSSISRLKFIDINGEPSIPPSLEMLVAPDTGSLDGSSEIRTSQPYEAIIGDPGKVWERNIISDNPSGETIMDLMFILPPDLTATEYANVINLIPFPVYDVDLIGVYYTLDSYPGLSVSGSTWVALNDDSKYFEDPDAVGYLPPGSWSGDEIIGCGPVSFVFPSKKITAFRITLRQQNPYNASVESGVSKYIYSYGLSHLDVRFEKFETIGKLIFEIPANSGDTISTIDTVMPDVYNVTSAGVTDVFSYRVIWETAPESGVYTTTVVPSSNRVWLEVTLIKDSLGNVPALTGFSVSYSL